MGWGRDGGNATYSDILPGSRQTTNPTLFATHDDYWGFRARQLQGQVAPQFCNPNFGGGDLWLRACSIIHVFRKTKIFRRPGPKCHSMSCGRRRFYVTSRRIFADPEYFWAYYARKRDRDDAHFETGAIRNRRTGPRTNGKMFLSFIIAIHMLIWHWSQNVTIQMTFARNWRNMCKWRTKWPLCLPIGQILMPHRTQNIIFCVESSSSEETPNTP